MVQWKDVMEQENEVAREQVAKGLRQKNSNEQQNRERFQESQSMEASNLMNSPNDYNINGVIGLADISLKAQKPTHELEISKVDETRSEDNGIFENRGNRKKTGVYGQELDQEKGFGPGCEEHLVGPREKEDYWATGKGNEDINPSKFVAEKEKSMC
ncbi:hypothetical protein SLA2020_012660 [Shorea laevis]